MTLRPIDNVLGRVEFSERRGDGSWMLKCPAHDDRRASLHLTETSDGVVLIKCYAGCDTEDVLAAMGLTTRDLFPPREITFSPGEPGGVSPRTIVASNAHDTRMVPGLTAPGSPGVSGGRIVATWDYRDSDGTLIFQTQRREFADGSKSFLQRTPDGNGGWIYKASGIVKPLYRQPEVAAADPALPVYIVEGERKVDYLVQWGLQATCSAGGAGKWQPHHSDVLRGRDLILLPDNDDPGRKHVSDIAASVEGLARSVKIVTLPDLPPKGDIVDWVDAGGTLTDFLALVAATPDFCPDKCLQNAGNLDFCRPTKVPDSASTSPPVRWRAFPLGLVPSPLCDYVELKAAALDVDPCQIILPLLTALGAAIGNTRRLHLYDDWRVPPILWTVVVCESGSGKTPALSSAIKFTKARQTVAWDQFRAEYHQYQLNQILYEKSLNAWRRLPASSDDPPSPPCEPRLMQYLVGDCTVEALTGDLGENPRGVLMVRDELSGWFGGHDRYTKGHADAAAYLEMYNAGAIQVNRKGSGRQFVERAAVALTGTIQPGILRRVLGREQRENGMQARLLFAYPERRIRQFTDIEIPTELEQNVSHVFDALWNLDFDRGSEETSAATRPAPICLRLNPAAMELFKTCTLQMRHEGHTLGSDLHAAFGKLEEIPARLALIIHFIRVATGDPGIQPDVVDEASMQSAIDITDWFKNETRRVYSMLSCSSPETPDSTETAGQVPLLDWIRSQGGSVSAREVVRNISSKYLNTRDAEAALNRLVQMGLGYWQVIQNPSGFGRPSNRFVISD